MRLPPATTSLLVCISLLHLTGCSEQKFKGSTEQGSADAGAPPPVTSPVVPNPPEPQMPVLGKLPAAGEPTVTSPTKVVQFGEQELFRIGDGFAGAQSSCVSEVTTSALKGTDYYFQFEVLTNDTTVNVSVGKICGVDNPAGTTLALIDSLEGFKVPEAFIAIDSAADRTSAWAPFSAQTLAKGSYSIVISSKTVNPSDPSDSRDDFLVGKIVLNADKEVKTLGVVTKTK